MLESGNRNPAHHAHLDALFGQRAENDLGFIAEAHVDSRIDADTSPPRRGANSGADPEGPRSHVRRSITDENFAAGEDDLRSRELTGGRSVDRSCRAVGSQSVEVCEARRPRGQPLRRLRQSRQRSFAV